MSEHAVYRRIVCEVKNGMLKEPFTVADFQKKCPGFGRGTYRAFLYKHRVGNPGKKTELFGLVGPGKFKVIRPFKYSLD
jgi:hypothetical protein